jgi:hypothetical protein
MIYFSLDPNISKECSNIYTYVILINLRILVLNLYYKTFYFRRCDFKSFGRRYKNILTPNLGKILHNSQNEILRCYKHPRRRLHLRRGPT